MNGKIRLRGAQTIEDKLAAVAVDVVRRHRAQGASPFPPDYADFRDAFRPVLQIETLLLQLSELKNVTPARVGARKRELVQKLLELDFEIEDL